jgi:ketosteroid isomerase-like protein
MGTKEVIQDYFGKLKQKTGWDALLGDDMVFTSFANPTKELKGKQVYLQSTKRFFSMMISVEVRDLLVEGEKACALTRYELKPPGGASFRSDVAEIFTVRNGRIDFFGIYFDASPYPK